MRKGETGGVRGREGGKERADGEGREREKDREC